MIKTNKLTSLISLLAFAFTIFSTPLIFAQQTYQSAPIRPQAVTGELLDLSATLDNRPDTRAHSGNPNYIGMSFTIDLGSIQPVIGVSQDHGRYPTHFPGAYKVEVAETPDNWFLAWQGEGQRGESKAVFEAVRARYIRVTATALNKTYNQEWSIAELRGGIDPGQKPKTIPPKRAPEPAPVETVKELENKNLAFDNKLDTFATSRTADYRGRIFNVDLGGEYEISRVVQIHGTRANDYPGEYKIEVSDSRNENKYREVFRGRGETARSVARFTPVITRFIRITALRNLDNQHFWSIAELRTNRDEDVVDRDDDDGLMNRQIRNLTGRGFSNLNALLDENNRTAATTRTTDYLGSFIQADLGGSYTIAKVVQVHEPDNKNFAGRYLVEISMDGNQWQRVFEGVGTGTRSVATFTPVRARYIRLTATDDKNNRREWTVYKLRIRG
ncbi:MAG: discoidin domain-containing protein [Acidobacteriota bacterium]